MKKLLTICFFTVLASAVHAQTEPMLIQFSGLIMTESDGRLIPVPYATISLPEKRRGTYSDYRGFFTIVVEKGEKVRFACVGLEPALLTIPDTLTQERYAVVQLMSPDTILLPEAVIFPWPSKEHFKIEFLKMDVTPELQRRATENLANEYMAEARKNPDIVPYSGRESANFYLRQQSREYYYSGQTPPMNIFSPLAWGQFFKAWKDGKFKRKNNRLMPLCRPFIFLLMLAGIGACGDAPPAPLSRPEKLAADLCKCTENLLALNAQAQSSADSLAFRNIAAAFENSARCIQNLGIKPEDKTLLAPALAQNCPALAKEQELLTELLGFVW